MKIDGEFTIERFDRKFVYEALYCFERRFLKVNCLACREHFKELKLKANLVDFPQIENCL